MDSLMALGYYANLPQQIDQVEYEHEQAKAELRKKFQEALCRSQQRGVEEDLKDSLETGTGAVKVEYVPTEDLKMPASAPPTNPKQLYGDKKPPVHLIHQIAELHESAALHAGRRKYGENNYLKTEVEAMTYVGAILRHVKAWASGERVDPKELVHHLGAVKACCTILMTTEATGMLIDNRPTTPIHKHNVSLAPRTYMQATAETFAEVERTIEHLNKLYPEDK
jgi:hypothetical protein